MSEVRPQIWTDTSKTIQTWWRNQSSFHRRVTAFVVGTVLTGVFVLAAALPSYDRLLDARLKYKAAYDLLQTAAAVADQVLEESEQRDNQEQAAATNLIQLVDKTAKAHDLSFAIYQPLRDDAIALSIEQQHFSALIEWLGAMQSMYGASPSKVAISSHKDKPGYVDAQVELSFSM